MTSDTAKNHSEARRLLDFALGTRRVSLSQLQPEEFEGFLQEILDKVDLHELRGFRPLKDLLSRSPGSFLVGQRQDPTETVMFTSDTKVYPQYLEAGVYVPNTQVVKVCRGVLRQSVTWCRYESNKTTQVWSEAQSWGRDAYINIVEESILVLRRTSDYKKASENLFLVSYQARKVPHNDEMGLITVHVQHVPLTDFRDRFQLRYSQVGRDLIWELASLTRLTLDALQDKVLEFRDTEARISRISKAIME